MRKKYVILLLIIVLMIVGGCSRVSDKPYAGDQNPNERIYEASEQFEQTQNRGQIIWYICGAVVICGILFKLGAIVTAIGSGRRLGRRVEEQKAREKEKKKELTPLEQETMRHLQYMNERRGKQKQ